MTHNNIIAIPYIFDKNGVAYNRLLIEPMKIAEEITESGILNPSHELKVCEIGKVVATCDGSVFKFGDEVLYTKIDRSPGEHLDILSLNDIDHDVVFENEVFCRNDEPVGRIFIEPISDIEVTEGGILMPHQIKGITQKGVVRAAPPGFIVQVDDRVEYRKKENDLYPEVVVNGAAYEVLFEADIFTINDVAAPNRIIVKIDIAKQSIKRTTSDAGIALSPLFIAMLRNLQLGEVTGIGSEAQKQYPELSIGDTAIIHHVVEAQPYRLIGHETGKEGNVTYEYRAINCWNDGAPEIYGKVHYEKKTGKIIDITPFNGNRFLEWEFDMLEKDSVSSLMRGDDDISQYRNLDDLKNVITHKKKYAAEKAKLKSSGIQNVIAVTDPETQKDQFLSLVSELGQMRKEETMTSFYLRKDHLVVGKCVYPRDIPSYVIAFYEELYPINILGKKFLIAFPPFIIAKTFKNMNIAAKDFLPVGDIFVLVLPNEEQKTSELLIPDSAKEKPQSGTVVTIGEDRWVKKGDTVLFIKSAGMEQELDGVKHLIMKRNDLMFVVNTTI